MADAKSYVVIVEDADAKPVTPFVHWLAWNIPARVTHLSEDLQEQLRLAEPEAGLAGRHLSRLAWILQPGRPPAINPPHRYHFQVFALDAVLDIQPGADRDESLRTMRGRVLAKGELVGLYQHQQRLLN